MINFKITKPKNYALKELIEYFLFIKSAKHGMLERYTTYPNTNCCLALYKDNTVNWDQNLNTCFISNLNVSSINSKLYGWHNRPFNVSVKGKLDQICILFSINGLSQFTKIPLNRLSLNDNPFEEIFGNNQTAFLLRLFNVECEIKRTKLLEAFLINSLVPKPISVASSYVNYLKNTLTNEKTGIREFCKKNNISESTLYRSCLVKIGESPKDIEIKLRFRLFLKYLNALPNLTQLSHFLNYTDQSHMIKEIKRLTELTPKKISNHIQREQNFLYLPY